MDRKCTGCGYKDYTIEKRKIHFFNKHVATLSTKLCDTCGKREYHALFTDVGIVARDQKAVDQYFWMRDEYKRREYRAMHKD